MIPVSIGCLGYSERSGTSQLFWNAHSYLYQGLDLDHKLSAAVAWCDEQGASNITVLREAEAESELVGALQLKRLTAKALLRREERCSAVLQWCSAVV